LAKELADRRKLSGLMEYQVSRPCRSRWTKDPTGTCWPRFSARAGA